MFVGELVKGTLIVAIAFVSRLLRVSHGGHGFGLCEFPRYPTVSQVVGQKNSPQDDSLSFISYYILRVRR